MTTEETASTSQAGEESGQSNPYLDAMDENHGGGFNRPQQNVQANQQQAQQEQPGQNQPNEKNGEDRVSWMAQLSRRDRHLSKRERDLNDRERGLTEKYNGPDSKYSKYQGLEDLKDPMELLGKFGFNEDQLYDRLLNDDDSGGQQGGQPTRVDPKLAAMEAHIAKLEERLTTQDKDREQRQQQQQEQQVLGVIQRQIGESADKYEILNHKGNEGVTFVKQLMDEYKKVNGIEADFNEAAKFAEDYYEKHYKTELDGFSKLNKFKSPNVQQASIPNQRSQSVPPQGQQSMGNQENQHGFDNPFGQQPGSQQNNPTLSNSDVGGSFQSNDSALTEEQRVQKAMAQLQFNDG